MSTNFQARIREIQSAFVMEFHDRETCIKMFEELLHDYKLLPKEELLDRAITNENFLTLLKTAKDSSLTVGRNPIVPNSVNAIEKYRIADTIKQRCPICEKPVPALFNRVQGQDQQSIPVDPPRCQDCMMKWVEEKFGSHKQVKRASLWIDVSPNSPLRDDEATFFAEYEKQMQENS